ncbi:carbohydrate ABC transporter permease [Thermococcus paralvinellae]|uniref:Multiple sugar-binding transport inner membrane protein n=1 Tax=Thermococcus paralvinellae TaxID=582419 RepID=W0I1Q1_9EURY|nr:carbohydrate ABC transporter permease [Thermococcus paralvinellae]AHF79924.1 multiple sugar-binding transport inner membrane protein [Thermococcus paralvinellae]
MKLEMDRSVIWLSVIGHILLIFATLAAFFPLYWMIASSLKPEGEIWQIPPTWIPHSITLDNYRTLFNYAPVFRWIINTIIIAGGGTLGVLILCSLAGYSLAKIRFPGNRIVFYVILGMLMIPWELTIIPVYVINTKLGLIDTSWALIIPGSVSAFWIFMFKQYMETIPDSLIEAARIDGASEVQIFLKIALPLAKPAVITIAILNFITYWKAFIWPLIMLNSWEKYPIEVGLALFRGQYYTEWGALMAGSTIAVLPLLIYFLVLQKRIIGGLTLGAIKG